eukprot:scaffold54685_cov19-Tisochrysis_lutea.AAC.1
MSKETPDSVPRSGICVLNIGTFEMLSKHFIWQPLFEKAVVNEPSQTLLNTTSTKELMLCLAPQTAYGSAITPEWSCTGIPLVQESVWNPHPPKARQHVLER